MTSPSVSMCVHVAVFSWEQQDEASLQSQKGPSLKFGLPACLCFFVLMPHKPNMEPQQIPTFIRLHSHLATDFHAARTSILI